MPAEDMDAPGAHEEESVPLALTGDPPRADLPGGGWIDVNASGFGPGGTTSAAVHTEEQTLLEEGSVPTCPDEIGETTGEGGCDTRTCRRVRINDDQNVNNVLNTSGTGFTAPGDPLFWGAGRVIVGDVNGNVAVDGALRVGASSAACSVQIEGSQRYNSVAKTMEFCDGASWTPLGVPSGAVLAFNRTTCPVGWSAYVAAAGRAIIGVGAGAGLTPRTLGDTGGEERHALTVSEMPSHRHVEMIPEVQSSNVVPASASDAPGGNRASVQPSGGALDAGDLLTGSTGGGQSHNVMQPYVALLYCQKS